MRAAFAGVVQLCGLMTTTRAQAALCAKRPRPRAVSRVDPKVELKVDRKVETKIEKQVELQVEQKVDRKVETIETKVEPQVELKVDRKVETKIETKVELQVELHVEPNIETKMGAKVETKTEPKVDTKGALKSNSHKRAKRARIASSGAWHAAVAPDIEDSGMLAARTRQVHEMLLAAGVNGPSSRRARRSVLDALISTILSQATTASNQRRAFASLTARFEGDWAKAHAAGPAEIEDAIRSAGLANRKAPRIHAILDSIYNEFGLYSLEHLREVDDATAIAALTKYNGVGPKTASCVLMFNMDRAELPVDTHVNRLSARLGWTRSGCSPESTYDLLNNTVDADIKYALHVQLIKHGRRTCKAQRPRCGGCPLSTVCPSAGAFDDDRESQSSSER